MNKRRKFQEPNKLDINSYIKPTNSFQYLHRKNSHDPVVIKGLIKSECKRPVKNTNDPTTLTILLQNIDKHLSKKGYSDTESQA